MDTPKGRPRPSYAAYFSPVSQEEQDDPLDPDYIPEAGLKLLYQRRQARLKKLAQRKQTTKKMSVSSDQGAVGGQVPAQQTGLQPPPVGATDPTQAAAIIAGLAQPPPQARPPASLATPVRRTPPPVPAQPHSPQQTPYTRSLFHSNQFDVLNQITSDVRRRLNLGGSPKPKMTIPAPATSSAQAISRQPGREGRPKMVDEKTFQARTLLARKRDERRGDLHIPPSGDNATNVYRANLVMKTREAEACLEALNEALGEDFPETEQDLMLIKIRKSADDAEKVYSKSYESLSMRVDHQSLQQMNADRDNFIDIIQTIEGTIATFMEAKNRDEKYASQAKIPQMKLEDFDGLGLTRFFDFQRWHQAFDDLILSRPGLTDGQKLHYMQASLKGEAKATVQGFTTGDQLPAAYEALYRRFGDPAMVVDESLNILMTFPRINDRFDHVQLQQMYNIYFCAVQSIQSHQEIPDATASLIIKAVLRKLPRHHVEMYHLLDREDTIDGFTEFFRGRVSALEVTVRSREEPRTVDLSRGMPTKQNTKSSKANKVSTQRATSEGGSYNAGFSARVMRGVRSDAQFFAAGGNRRKGSRPSPPNRMPFKRNETKDAEKQKDDCVFCGFNHPSFECRKVQAMSPEERVKRVIQQQACLCCLRYRHFANTCRRRRLCTVKKGNLDCREYHHPLLHGINIADILRKFRESLEDKD